MPLLGLGRSVAFASDHVSPPSVDSDRQMKPIVRVDRHSAMMAPFAVCNSVGWMMPCGLPGTWIGPCRVHVLPSSVERSTHEHQARWLSTEVGARIVPLISIGLFLIGPSSPAGRISDLPQFLPTSSDRFTKPDQVIGLGPAL